MTGFLKFCWMLSVLVAALAWPVALAMDAAATEALPIVPFAPEVVEVNRATETLDPKAADYEMRVAGIYGTPSKQGRGRFLFVPKERYLHPRELPSLTLITINKQNGENPLQAQTVRFFAQWVNLGAMAAVVLFLLAWIYRRRTAGRRAVPDPAGPLPSDRPDKKD
jgi:hypothetical protein